MKIPPLPESLLRASRLEKFDDDIRLFVCSSLSKKLAGFQRTIHSRQSIALEPPTFKFGPEDTIIQGEATLELEYVLEISSWEKVIFDILIDSSLRTIIDLRSSNAILEIENLKTADIDEVVRHFILDADILSIMLT